MGSLTRHVFETLALNAGIAVHVRVLAGRDPHHIVEAQFKALARALRAAVEPRPAVVRRPEHQGHPVTPPPAGGDQGIHWGSRNWGIKETGPGRA